MYLIYYQEIQNPDYCVQVELKCTLKMFVKRFLLKEPPCLAHTFSNTFYSQDSLNTYSN